MFWCCTLGTYFTFLGDPRSSENYYSTRGTGLRTVFGFYAFNEITISTHNTKTAQITKNIEYGSLLHTNEISQTILEQTYKYYKTDCVGG
jgi:hypothetical protein